MTHAVAVTHVNLMLRWMVSGDSSPEPEESNSLIKSCAEFAMDISPADTGWRAALTRGSGTAPASQSLAGAERRLGLFVDGAEYEHLVSASLTSGCKYHEGRIQLSCTPQYAGC